MGRELSSNDLHRSLVVKGWDLHLRLVRRATNLRRFATAMVVSIATLMLTSTVLAMTRIWLKFHDVLVKGRGGGIDEVLAASPATDVTEQQVPHERLLDIALVVLPISVLLLMTIQGSFQIAHSWASYHMGASKVVAEIYFFLGGVAPYDQSPAANQRRFLKRLRDMVKRLSVSGVREEDLVRSANGEQAAPNMDAEVLQSEIHKSLYGIEPLWLPCRKIRDCLRSCCTCCNGGTWGTLLDGPEHHDLAAPVNAEIYMEVRIAPLKKYYGDTVRAVARLRMILYCALMVVICISVGIGATDHFDMWIPATLGVVSFLTTITHWLTPPEIIAAINSAISVLQKMELRWQGSDIRENRSDVTRQRLISATEHMVLAVERAMCRATAVPEADDDDHDLDEGDRDENNEAKPDQRSRTISVAVTPMNMGSGAMTPLGIAYARNSQEEDGEFASQRSSRRRPADKLMSSF